MGAFSNFALSFSIICILAGGVTSFHLGYCGVGGAAIGLGWPLGCLFALVVALTMAQVASAFPTAGGLYHWAAILGGGGGAGPSPGSTWRAWSRRWRRSTSGRSSFARGWLASTTGGRACVRPAVAARQAVGVAALVGSQAFLNHRGVRLVARSDGPVGLP